MQENIGGVQGDGKDLGTLYILPTQPFLLLLLLGQRDGINYKTGLHCFGCCSSSRFGLVTQVQRRIFSEEVLAGTETPGGVGRARLYITLHCHHQNDSCVKMGNVESLFNVLLFMRATSQRQCPETTIFEEERKL